MDWSIRARNTTSLLSKGVSRRQLFLFGLASCVAVPPAFASEGARPGSFSAIGGDDNGTIDLEQAKRAAEIRFQHLDRHHTGKLSWTQLGRRRVTLQEFSWADRDHEGTLDKDEYLTLVERQFRAADLDHDGRVSRAEFYATAGLPLRRLLY